VEEVLENGEETYYPALRIGSEKSYPVVRIYLGHYYISGLTWHLQKPISESFEDLITDLVSLLSFFFVTLVSIVLELAVFIC
jgi:hypothetical protein